MLRTASAVLLTASGIGHIAVLWLRDIDNAVLLGAALGSVYLFVGIGLFGKSRFTLVTAMIFPPAGIWLTLSGSLGTGPGVLAAVLVATEALVVIGCAIVLFRLRNTPGR